LDKYWLMIIVVQDLNTGGGERVLKEFLKYVKLPCNLYTKEKFVSERIDVYSSENWSTIGLVFKAFKILIKCKIDQPVLIVLTKPMIIFGILNIFFKRNIFLYEHADPTLLYFPRNGYVNSLKAKLLKISLKYNKTIVVTNKVKNNLLNETTLNNQQLYVVKNPNKKITQKLDNISRTNINRINIYLIIGRDSPEKKLNEAIQYYNSIKSKETSLWIISDTERTFYNIDMHFKNYEELNHYVNEANIIYEPILLNFSEVESYSLIIAEFLSAKLTVWSVYSETLADLWSNYYGFYLIKNVPKNGLKSLDNREVFKSKSTFDYAQDLIKIISKKTTNEK